MSVSAAPAVGLTPDQLREISEARTRVRKIRSAVTLARFDFWGTAIFGGLTVLGSLVSFSLPGLLLGLAMAAVAYFEHHGANDLSNLELTAPRRLACNQLFFAAALLAYAAWTLFYGLNHLEQYTGLIASQMPPELSDSSMVISINSLTKLILILLYGTLAVVALTVQPGTALFYFSREKHLRAYLSQTPRWILDAQRAGVSL
ncbi:MAG TPA: hypothetical protein VF669_01315 [Tepidisphaeraceae bacterium]